MLDGNGGRAVLADFDDGRPVANLIGFAPLDGASRPAAPPAATHRPPSTLRLAVQLPTAAGWTPRRGAGPPPGWALPSLVTLAVSAAWSAWRSCSPSAGSPGR